MRERIRRLHCATLALCRSQQVADAGALAPVVFSGQPGIETGKIRRINGKGGPYPPKSTMANTMVVLVSIENACKTRFEAQQFENPKHGIR